MFNLDPAKLLIIGVVAVILLGPDKLPQVARQFGGAWRTFNEFRHRMETEVRSSIPDLPSTNDIARLARSPSALLNHLSNMDDRRDDPRRMPPAAAGAGAGETGAADGESKPATPGTGTSESVTHRTTTIGASPNGAVPIHGAPRHEPPPMEPPPCLHPANPRPATPSRPARRHRHGRPQSELTDPAHHDVHSPSRHAQGQALAGQHDADRAPGGAAPPPGHLRDRADHHHTGLRVSPTSRFCTSCIQPLCSVDATSVHNKSGNGSSLVVGANGSCNLFVTSPLDGLTLRVKIAVFGGPGPGLAGHPLPGVALHHPRPAVQGAQVGHPLRGRRLHPLPRSGRPRPTSRCPTPSAS